MLHDVLDGRGRGPEPGSGGGGRQPPPEAVALSHHVVLEADLGQKVAGLY